MISDEQLEDDWTPYPLRWDSTRGCIFDATGSPVDIPPEFIVALLNVLSGIDDPLSHAAVSYRKTSEQAAEIERLRGLLREALPCVEAIPSKDYAELLLKENIKEALA